MSVELIQARMRGHAARATIGNVIETGLVLDTNLARCIFNVFGLGEQTLSDFRMIAERRPEHFERRIGVPIVKSHYRTPALYWDPRKYSDYDSAYEGYAQRFKVISEFIDQLYRPRRIN